MTVEIRGVPVERWVEFMKTAEIAFVEDIDDREIARMEPTIDKERFICAIDRDQFVGTSGVFTQRLSVPGGEVAAGGITFVCVVPSHRRRGLMSSMMRLMIDDCHRRGEPIAMLWAAEAAIYQRFGFGLATLNLQLNAETQAIRYTRPWPREGTFRLMPAGQGQELVQPVYEAARRERAGFLMRDDAWWPARLPDPEKDHKGGEAAHLVVYETDDGPEAYAIYKNKGEWSERGPSHLLTVWEAMASTPRGLREIWRWLLDVDLVRSLKARRLPVDHPIFSLVAEPRRLGAVLGDGIWIRIVDVPSALESRTYGFGGMGEGRIVFDLDDEYCPWNAGRWSLEVAGGRARVARTNDEPDLSMSANELGGIFLGGISASALAQAGRMAELRAGGLPRMDSLFATSLQPWCPQDF